MDVSGNIYSGLKNTFTLFYIRYKYMYKTKIVVYVGVILRPTGHNSLIS